MQKKSMTLLIIGLIFFVVIFTFSAYGIRAGVKVNKEIKNPQTQTLSF